MENEKLKTEYKKDNIRLLRRYLRLTQEEFINQFLADENGKASMSVATLSNLESKGGKRLNEVVLTLSENLAMDITAFSMKPEEFAENLDNLLPNSTDTEVIQKSSSRKGSINQLLNELTMYFADQLFDKRLKKGDKIESDRVLASKFGVGRSAVREALKVLDVLGMIDIRPGQGSYISSNEANFFIIPLSWSLFLNGNQVDDIVEVRNLLQVRAAELAAECEDKEYISRLYEISHKSHRAYVEQNYKEFLEDDLEFHLCIAQCSQNQVIYSLMQTINNLMKRVSRSGMVNSEQLKHVYEEHQKIYGFILAHDAKGAREAMEDHVKHSVERYDYRS
ncbi:MAG: FadR family transcriptional regulator [Clostridiales bacterium]|nr:FadR family transcriptional regulator [Clostridiales bacterium]